MRVQAQKGKKRDHPSTDDLNVELVVSQMKKSVFFCFKSSGKLHHCATMGLDRDIRKMATDLEDTRLLARISGGD